VAVISQFHVAVLYFKVLPKQKTRTKVRHPYL
jgi:hypothetical protein